MRFDAEVRTRILTGEQEARLTYLAWAFLEGIMLEHLSSLREEEPLMLQALNFIDSRPHAAVRALPAQSTRRNHIS